MVSWDPPRSLIALRDWFSRLKIVYRRVTDGQLDTYGATCICFAMRRALKLSDFQSISFYISEASKRHTEDTLTVATNSDGAWYVAFEGHLIYRDYILFIIID